MLWDELLRISSSMSGAWLVAGDLNDILGSHECKGVDVINSGKVAWFARRIDACHLMDLGSVGSKFTWRGPTLNGVQTFRRLDRVLCNDNWRFSFSNAFVKVLPRVDFSDHHPILVNPYGASTVFRAKPFRFERAWQTHPDFNDVILNG